LSDPCSRPKGRFTGFFRVSAAPVTAYWARVCWKDRPLIPRRNGLSGLHSPFVFVCRCRDRGRGRNRHFFFDYDYDNDNRFAANDFGARRSGWHGMTLPPRILRIFGSFLSATRKRT
jgi:hypothetical protein